MDSAIGDWLQIKENKIVFIPFDSSSKTIGGCSCSNVLNVQADCGIWKGLLRMSRAEILSLSGRDIHISMLKLLCFC